MINDRLLGKEPGFKYLYEAEDETLEVVVLEVVVRIQLELLEGLVLL